MWVSIIQSIKDLNRQKGWWKENSPSLMVDLGHWCSDLRLWPPTLALLVLRTWDFDLNLYHQQSGFQAFGCGLEFILSVLRVLNPSDLNELVFTNLKKTTVAIWQLHLNYTTGFYGSPAYRRTLWNLSVSEVMWSYI